jgi:hypothetical protein
VLRRPDRHVSEQAILDVVERNRDDIDGALRALVKAANRSGGQDNITVVAFEIAEVAPASDGDTREQALPPAVEEDDEDTLTEADAVPTVDTGVVSVEEIRAEGKASQRRHLRRRLLAWLAIVLLVAVVAVLVYLRFVR